MKKEIIKPLFLWILAEAVLFVIFVLQDSVTAIFCFFFLIFLAAISFSSCFFVKDKLFAKAVLPPAAEKKAAVRCKILLENKSAFPVFNALCKVLIKNRLNGEENEIFVRFFVLPKSKAEKEIEISSEFCGYVTAKIERICLTDIFGFLPVAAKKIGSEKGKMTVLPETFSPVIVFDEALPVPEDSESYSPDKKGFDFSETFQIREYAPGDSVKQIHWKLSEKLDRTIVRDASLPIAKNIMLFWDKTGNATPKETDSMAEVTSSVAQSLLQSGFEFTLCWNEENRVELAQIKEESDLLEAIPRLIKFSAEKSEEENGFFEHFGKTICIAKEVPKELYQKPGVSILLCGKTAAESGIIPFDAEKYTEDLAFLEL